MRFLVNLIFTECSIYLSLFQIKLSIVNDDTRTSYHDVMESKLNKSTIVSECDFHRITWAKRNLVRELHLFGDTICMSISMFIHIIIIMSRRLRGYPWPSLAISPYHSSPPAGLQDYNPCPHIAAVCKFVLVVPHLHIHEWGSTGVHRLWARPCFSSSVPRVWFVELVWQIK